MPHSPRLTSRLALIAATALVAVGVTACHGSSSPAAAPPPSTSTSSTPVAPSSEASVPTPGESGSVPATPGTSGEGAHTADMVVVKNFMFQPMSLTVAAGAQVTWKFEDTVQHTVAFTKPAFTSPSLADGKTYSHTFATPGTYDYICSIHPYMHGTIIVKSGG